MDETQKFLRWWLDDKERSKCTLVQAISAYCATFPGRPLSLLVELLKKQIDPRIAYE